MSKDQLEYSFQPTSRPRCTLLTLKGGLTLGHIFELQNQLRDLDTDLLILDCTELEYMDSAGLGVVVNFYVSQSSKGGKVAIVNISDRVWALFTSTRVDQYFSRFASVDAAVSSL